MATRRPAKGSADDDGIHRPQALKPGNPAVLRAQHDESQLKVNGGSGVASGVSSGRSTPVPPDAPPSVQSIFSARKQIRAAQRQRLFPTVEYAARVSHFDPRSEYRDFRGFFVLFWIGLAILVLTTMLRSLKETGLPIRLRPWMLFTVDAWQLALSDAAMTASTALALPMQRRFRGRGRADRLAWGNYGMAVHIVFEAVWLALWVNWPFVLRWTWTAQVFFTLHLLVMLMKLHSYAFYNGHLSVTEARLAELDDPARHDGASHGDVVRYPSPSASPSSHRAVPGGADHDHSPTKAEATDDAALARLREALAVELTSPLGRVTFPENLTVGNFVDFLFCPTLCYELEYPRTPRTQWSELFYKVLAIFGCIFLMTITSEEFIVPVLSDAASRLRAVDRLTDKGLIMAETISSLLFPFMVTFLLVFLVIFEYILGACAEITRFADRQFYADWWNSCDWLEFSREWNIPVHNFLRRHVYHASLPYMPRGGATAITFFVSALLHELVMGCITKKLRGYGFVAMMLQIPIVALQRSPVVRGKELFNNTMFWISMISGLSVLCTMYVLV